MRKFQYGEILREAVVEVGPGGGSSTIVHHGDAPVGEPETEPEKVETKKDDEPKGDDPAVIELREQLAEAKRQAAQDREDAQFWANRAKNGKGEDDRPRTVAPEPRKSDDKPEKILDDLALEGSDALEKRGYVKVEKVQEMIQQVEERMSGKVTEATRDAEFGLRMKSDFPEIYDDVQRVNRSERPQGEAFELFQKYYQEALADDPGAQKNKAVIVQSARLAMAELKSKAKKDDPPPDPKAARTADKRERVDRQAPDATRGKGFTTEPEITSEAKTVMANLGISDKEYATQARRR